MNDSIFTPGLVLFGFMVGTVLAWLELLWLRRGKAEGNDLIPFITLSVLNLGFLCLIVGSVNSYLALLIFPLPVIPILYLVSKAIVYFVCARRGAVHNPISLAFLSLFTYGLLAVSLLGMLGPLNPTRQNLQLAIREKQHLQLEAMLWMSVPMEPAMSMLVNEAIMSDDPDALRCLMRHGADPRGEYWLDHASSGSLWLLVHWMLDSGVTPDEITASRGPRIEEIAIRYGPDELRYCLAKGFEPRRFPSVLAEAIRAGTPVNTPAASTRLVEMLRLLLDHGAGVNANDYFMMKPISALLARDGELPSVLTFLISRGADVNARTVNKLQRGDGLEIPAGATPLILAVMLKKPIYAEILLANRANATLADASGRTALDHAREPGVDESIRRQLGIR
jgi:ankyrin repeat protein